MPMNAFHRATSGKRPADHSRYFVPLASVAGASTFAFAALPQQMGGLVSLLTVSLLIVIDQSTRRSIETRPRGTRAVLHLVLTGLVYVGSLILAVTLARGEALWVAGLLAVVVFLAVGLGAWVPNRGAPR